MLFQRMTDCVTPFFTHLRFSLGRPSPITLTAPVLPACLTASAAPGTAGEQMAMMRLRFGLALRRAVASLWALSLRSSQGRRATIFMLGCLEERRASMYFCHSFMFAAVRLAVMMANSPESSQRRAA